MAKNPFETNNNFRQQRYNQLLELGFSREWIDKVAEVQPSLYEDPYAKTKGLEERGFKDPHKLIRSLPQILGLAFENIDRKIRLLYLIHGDKEKAISEIEAFPPLFGYKWRRLLFAVRTSNSDGLRRLITISPQLLAAAKGRTGSSDPTRLAAEVRTLKGLDIDQILNALVDEKAIDLRLIRALDRI